MFLRLTGSFRFHGCFFKNRLCSKFLSHILVCVSTHCKTNFSRVSSTFCPMLSATTPSGSSFLFFLHFFLTSILSSRKMGCAFLVIDAFSWRASSFSLPCSLPVGWRRRRRPNRNAESVNPNRPCPCPSTPMFWQLSCASSMPTIRRRYVNAALCRLKKK